MRRHQLAVPHNCEMGNVTLSTRLPAPRPATSSAGLRWTADESHPDSLFIQKATTRPWQARQKSAKCRLNTRNTL